MKSFGAPPDGLNRKKILIISDDPGSRDAFRRTMNSSDLQNISFAGADEGSRMAKAERPDVVIIDMADQAEAFLYCKALKEGSAPAGFKMVVMTSDIGDATLAGARKCGADAYFLRTKDYSSITNVIRLIL